MKALKLVKQIKQNSIVPQSVVIKQNQDVIETRIEKIKGNLESSRNALKNLEQKNLKQIKIKATSVEKANKSKTYFKQVIQGKKEEQVEKSRRRHQLQISRAREQLLKEKEEKKIELNKIYEFSNLLNTLRMSPTQLQDLQKKLDEKAKKKSEQLLKEQAKYEKKAIPHW